MTIVCSSVQPRERLQLYSLDELHDPGKALVTALLETVIMIHVFALGIAPDTIGPDKTVEVGVLV